VLVNLMQCMERNKLVELMYMNSKSRISKRREKVLEIQSDTFQQESYHFH